MRASLAIPILAMVGLPFAASGDAEWSLVPAARDARSLDTFTVPGVPTEKVVSYVGRGPKPSSRVEPRPVVSFGFDAQPAGRDGSRPRSGAVAYSVPDGAHWPDADGRITAMPTTPRDGPNSLFTRNPWEVRSHGAAERREVLFLFAGVIAGGDGPPVGILNGHVVRQGDTLGSYRVVGILAAELVLEARGSYFVVPRGAQTTISEAKA